MNEVSVWRFGKIIWAGENESTYKKTCPSASLSTANHVHCLGVALKSVQ